MTTAHLTATTELGSTQEIGVVSNFIGTLIRRVVVCCKSIQPIIASASTFSNVLATGALAELLTNSPPHRSITHGFR